MQAQGQSVQGSSNRVPRLPHSFNFFIHLSRKVGMVATRTSVVINFEPFFNRDTVVSRPERRFMSIVPKLVLSRSRDSSESKSKQRDKERHLKEIVSQSHEVLITANTVFPITLFPDSVTVDRTKVTITRRDFFWSSDVLSIRIEDVLNVQVSVGPLFGSLTIASRVMSTVDHFQISHLWRGDAIHLKHMIQGYVIAQHNKIDTSHLRRKELIETLVELGQDSNMQ